MERSFNLGTLLKNREKKHKIKPAQFVSIAGGIQKRLETNLKNRRSSRLTIFDKIRNLPACESPLPISTAQTKVERRRQQLEKWKEEKEKRKKEQAAQKKKPFVAGVAHAPLKFVPPPPVAPSTSGRVTRSQSAKNNVTKKVEQKAVKPPQSFAPKNASFRPPQIKNLTKVPILAPVTKPKESKSYVFNFSTAPSFLKQNDINTKQTRSRAIKLGAESRAMIQRNAKELKDDKILKGRVGNKQSHKLNKPAKNVVSGSSSSETEPIVPEVESKVSKVNTPKRSQRKTKNTTPKSESNSEERLRSPKSPANDLNSSGAASTPMIAAEESKRISPCVTLSRGKDNARREMKKKLEEGLLDEDTRDSECVEDFRRQLNLETIRLTEMCDSWEKIREQTPLAEVVQDEVLGAVGQARLLMSSKLQQFSSLVERCARPAAGAPLVTASDLQGFWDMVFMQIVNIDMRFKRLEQRRERNWADETTSQPAIKVPRNNVKKTTKPAAGPSRLREMIAAARKAKKQQEEQSTAEAPVIQGVSAPSEDNKTFEAGFFCVRSPVRSPAPATPNNKTSLLKAVLSSEAKKASTSKKPFAMLRASIMSKSLESEGIAPLPQTPLAPININATPGRSILKSTNVSKSGKKSIKVVLFDESDAEIQDKHLNEIPKDKIETEQNTDSGLSSMDVEKEVENKENSRRKSKIVRQDAVEEERSPVMTRNRRKSAQNTPQEVKTRSRRTLQATAENIEVIPTPKRSSRRRKSATLQTVKA